MYLGKCDGFDCYVSETSTNGSVIITGQSGSGKSCKMNQMELKEVLNGNTVIVIDYSQNHREKDIFKKIREEYISHSHRIDAVKDGLGMEILSPIVNKQGECESFINLVNANVRAFSASQKMGIRQQAIIRKAVEAGIELKKRKPNLAEEEVLKEVFLLNEEDALWQSVYQRLWTVLNCNALRAGTKHLEAQAINIIDLSALDMLSSEMLAEVILAYLWRIIYHGGFPGCFGNVIVALDEFQHCSIRKDSTLRIMLRESRKFGLSLILATQSLGIFSAEELSMLHQTSTHLYFRPTDVDVMKCAKAISPSRTSVWMGKLAKLERGECIAVGTLEANGHVITRPLKLV